MNQIIFWLIISIDIHLIFEILFLYEIYLDVENLYVLLLITFVFNLYFIFTQTVIYIKSEIQNILIQNINVWRNSDDCNAPQLVSKTNIIYL